MQLTATRIGCLAAVLLSAPPAFGQAMKKDMPPKMPPPATAAPAVTFSTGMFPAGGNPGKTTAVVVEGGALTGATGLWFGHPGITGKLVSAGATDTEIKAEITVAADVPAGLYPWRIQAHKGVSAPRMFAVGTAAEVAEVEPNDEPAKAQPVTAGAVINGRLDKYDDIDCFRFTAKAGQRLLITCQCRALGGAAEPALALLDGKDKLLATPRQNDFVDGDPFIDFTFPEAGDYSVRIWNLTRGDDKSRIYRLAFSSAPLVQFAYPAGAKRGATVALELGVRDPSGTLGRRLPDTPFTLVPATVTVPANHPDATFPVALPGNVAGANTIRIAVGDLPEVNEVEPNDEPAKAMPVPLPSVVNGRLSGRGHLDYFRVQAKKGQVIVMDVAANKIGSPGDLAMAVLNAKGDEIAKNDDAGPDDKDPRIVFTAPEDGAFVVRVGEVVPERITGPENIYRLTLREPTPDFALSAPEHTVMVGSGATAALTVNVTRIDGFAEAVKLTVTGAPADFKVEAPPVAAGAAAGVVRVTAPAGADGRSFPIRINGEATVGGKPAVRHVMARVDLVKLDGKPVNTVYDPTIFVGVGSAPPFSLAAAPAAVETTPGGAFTIKVTATRGASVTGAIDLTVVSGPDGTAAVKGQIPAGAPSADLAFKLAPTATASGVLVISGSTKVGNDTVSTTAGPVEVSIKAPGFAATLPAPTAATYRGGSATFTVKVAPEAGFASPVTLAAVVPAGFTASPVTVAAGGTTGALVVTVPADAKPGPVMLKISATATVGGKPKVVELPAATLTVDDPFTAALAAASVPAKPGAAAEIAVNITRKGGFAGPVTLSAAGLPAGFRSDAVVVAPTAVQGVLRVKLPADAKPGPVGNIAVSAESPLAGKPLTIPAGTVTLNIAAAETKKEEPKKTEPKKTEPKKEEPKKTEPKKEEPKKTEPPVTTPGKVDVFTVGFANTAVAGKAGGTADLPVTVTRKAGWAHSVTFTLAGLPPGFAAEPVRVARDAGQGVIRITIPAEAKVGRVGNIVVNATGTVDDKRVTVPVGTITIDVTAK